MIVLDTNVVSELLRPAPDARVVAWIGGLSGAVAVTAVAVAELLAGVRRLPEGRRKAVLEEQLAAIVRGYGDAGAILPFDHGAARHYADVLHLREQAGRPIATADAQIAAICRSHQAICATRNTRDFEATGVELVDPWSPPAP